MKALPDCEKLLMTDVAVCIFFYSVMRDSCGSRQLFGTITTSTLDSSSLDFFKAAAALKKKKVGSRATQESGVSPAHKWDPNNDHHHSIQLENV